MKIAIPVNGHRKGDLVAPHFGRAENFMIFNKKEKNYNFYKNPQNQSKEEFLVEFIKEKEVGVIICFGLKKETAQKLKNKGVKLYRAQQGSLFYNLEEFKKGHLEKLYS